MRKLVEWMVERVERDRVKVEEFGVEVEELRYQVRVLERVVKELRKSLEVALGEREDS